eukprot:4029-Heterococcus_DN1.PRE.10
MQTSDEPLHTLKLTTKTHTTMQHCCTQRQTAVAYHACSDASVDLYAVTPSSTIVQRIDGLTIANCSYLRLDASAAVMQTLLYNSNLCARLEHYRWLLLNAPARVLHVALRPSLAVIAHWTQRKDLVACAQLRD